MGLFHKYICFISPKMVPMWSQDKELMQNKDKSFPEGLELRPLSEVWAGRSEEQC